MRFMSLMIKKLENINSYLYDYIYVIINLYNIVDDRVHFGGGIYDSFRDN